MLGQRARVNASPAILRWTAPGRGLVFALAATSIWCLLAEFYGLCSMRTFALWILIPATAALAALALHDRVRGDRRLWRGVMIGIAGGLAAAVAYDLFRLPFVFSREWGLQGLIPAMPLFKVFPGFGAMLLGEPANQAHYSLAAHLLGWAYHFSNGATFGVMYTAATGEPSRRHWAWAVLMAVGIELAMLASPYTSFFGIGMTGLFVAVTMAAHAIFGATLGLWARAQSSRWGVVRPSHALA
jgi:hypothetical protein